MMTCRDCAELLMEFLEGELDAEQCERIRRHLEGCPPCTIYVETYQITVRLTSQLPCGPLPPEVAQRLRAVLAQSLDQ
jgi:anti-sigma factor RsiW